MAGGGKKSNQESGRKTTEPQKPAVEPETVEWVHCQSCVGWFQADVTPGLMGKSSVELKRMEFVCPLCRMEKRFQLLLDEVQVERVRKEVELQEKVKKQHEEIGQLRAQLRDQAVKLSKVSSCSCRCVAKTVADCGTDPVEAREQPEPAGLNRVMDVTDRLIVESEDGMQRDRQSTYAEVTRRRARAGTVRGGAGSVRVGAEGTKGREKPLQVLLLGDSIPRECVKREVEKSKQVEIDDRCVSGAGVVRMREMIRRDRLTERSYDLVIMSIGTNDGPSGPRRKSGVEAHQAAEEIEDIVMAFRARGTHVRVMGLLPRGDRGTCGTREFWCDGWGRTVNAELSRRAGPGCTQEKIAAFCATERYFCTYRHGVPYVDEQMFAADGVHLSYRGKMQLARCVEEIIAPFL